MTVDVAHAPAAAGAALQDTRQSAIEPEQQQRRVVNDFSIQVATVNGSGSQTANNVLMRSIFRMGVPVSGKNLFPSNIAGLPTWFTIRANSRGFIARRKEVDFLVAMNPESAMQDIAELPPGAACVFDEPLRLDKTRSDIHFYPVPFDKLVAPVCPEAKLRKLVRNMIYDGVVAHLLGIDLEEMRAALVKQFGPKKAKAAELNWNAVLAGRDYAAANLVKTDPFHVERDGQTTGKIIIDGNSAAALGCVFAGATVLTWYPITPSSSLAEALIGYFERLRVDPESGRNTFAVVQAEDELAAVGMAIGAGWAGARAMTCTSGPGISLMAEFVGLAYYAEIPVVIIDVQRVGPSTGLPTRTMQGDLLSNALLSHGDTIHPVLMPASPQECFEMAETAFNLAEQFQTPVFINTDLDLGMNNWMADPFEYSDKPLQRGKVLTAEDLERLGDWGRYRDVDGDGVPWRTLPGTAHASAAYFTRGSGHTSEATYSEKPADYIENVDRLRRKFETLRGAVPASEIVEADEAQIGLVCCGTSRYAVEESCYQLEQEHGIRASWLRVKAFPFPDDVRAFLQRYRRVYVVDQNRDGQLLSLMKLEFAPGEVGHLRSVRYYGGLPLDARTVTDEVFRQERL
jgi:2-oxoglutarate/2-oxoacid ferredoxin oxidoreductase subunit alpha